MVSTFGCLDTDSEQRRKMLEVVDLFKEEALSTNSASECIDHGVECAAVEQ
jgi:hypothetical protein